MYKENFYSLEIEQEVEKAVNKEKDSLKAQDSSSPSQKRQQNQDKGEKLYFQKQQLKFDFQFKQRQIQQITISSAKDENQFRIVSEAIMEKRDNLQNQINDNQFSAVPHYPHFFKENKYVLISDESSEQQQQSQPQSQSQSQIYTSISQPQSSHQQNLNLNQNQENNEQQNVQKQEYPQQYNHSKPRQRTRQPYPQKSSTSTMKYIADNKFALDILQLFSIQGQIKVLFQDDPLETKIHKYYNSQKEDLAKFYQSEDMKEPDYFFISKVNRQYEFVEGKLQDKKTYLRVKCSNFSPPKYQIIYEILNLISIQLDPAFVKDLQIIVDIYVQMHQNGAQTDDIISKIHSQNIKYMKIWETVKSHFKSVLVQKKNIVLQQKKIQLQALVSEKLKQKYFKLVEKQQLELYQEIKIRPITYLLTQLFKIFNQIIYNEENQMELRTKFKQEVDNKN